MNTSTLPSLCPATLLRLLQRFSAVALFGVITFTSVSRSPAASLSWSGGGANGNWSTIDNWGFAGVPANGDTLVFSGGQPRMLNTNDIAGLVLNQIRFVGPSGGYDIRGNAFTLTNHIEATNTAGINAIENNIALSNIDQIVNVSLSSLTLSGAVSGAVSLIKSGAGTLTLAGVSGNTYAGTTLVRGGTLALNKFSNLGAQPAIPNSLILSNNTTAQLLQAWQLYQPVRSFALTNTLYPGSVLDLNGNSEWLSQISLTAAQIKSGAAGLLYLSGDITVVSNNITSSFISGNLQLYNYLTCLNNTVTNTGPCPFSPDLFITANISSGGTNSLIKSGPGQLELGGTNNTYAGETIINAGSISVDYTNGLGATNLPATVKSGASLYLNNTAAIGLKPLFISGNGYSIAALAAFGFNSWAGNITLVSNTLISSHFPGDTLTLSGAISGPGALTKVGVAKVSLTGASPNTYAGLTTVANGTLELGKSAFVNAIPGNVDVFGTLLLANDEQIPDSADVNLESGSVFDFGTHSEFIDTLHGLGGITFGALGYLSVGANNGSSTYDGVMSGIGYAPGYTIRKNGTGVFTMNGNNTFTAGIARADGGKFLINGFQPQVGARASLGATLGGTGTVGVLSAFGSIAPGSSPGILNSSNVTFTGTGNLTVELTGPNPGPGGYDQLKVNGGVTLASATLTVVPAFVNPVGVGQKFVIIDNDSSEAITNTFSGLPEGSSLNFGNYAFTLSYLGGDGNDVVLTLTNVPGASAGYAVNPGGDGLANITANDCKYFSLVFSNKTGTPMTGVSAAVLSGTPNVAVTQPFSPYANVAANGTATNQVLFQISTTTNFVCGTNINLNLAVTTATHGTFLVPFVLQSGIPAPVPTAYGISVVTNIPDVGTIESTNVVAGFVGPLAKVAVSLWLTHPIDSDLTISLVSPNGTVVPLVAGVGAGANFGSACSPDSSRTTFDDNAAISITAGSSPFVGMFRPQGSLAAFVGGLANGNWRLRVNDNVGGSVGALRCWTLNLYPLTCPSGGGNCELCPNLIVFGATGSGSPTQSGLVDFNGVPSVCGVPKVCPGTVGGGPYPSDNYTFRNGPTNACVTVTVSNASPDVAMLATVYSGNYDRTNSDKCLNYLADGGYVIDDANPTQSFSFNVASNATFVVNLIASSFGLNSYSFKVTGGDCRPVLNITPAGPNTVKLDWTTAAANYRLESTNTLVVGATNWPSITNIPTVINSRYTVTNSAPLGSKFYRLHKP